METFLKNCPKQKNPKIQEIPFLVATVPLSALDPLRTRSTSTLEGVAIGVQAGTGTLQLFLLFLLHQSWRKKHTTAENIAEHTADP